MNAQTPLKIVFLTSSYPRNPGDYASGFLRNLAEHLSQRGIHIHVLAPSDEKKRNTFENGVTVHRFQYLPVRFQRLAYGSGILPNLRAKPWLWLQVPFFILSMAYALFRLIRKSRPDLIHAHWILPQGIIAVLAKYIYKIPVITTAHGSDSFALKGKPLDRLKRFALVNSDAWTSNTRATSEAIGPIASLPKPEVIPMGIDVKLFSSGAPLRFRREMADSALVVLFVGRLVTGKGCYELLNAFSLLPAELRSRAHLWLVGAGEEHSKLLGYANCLDISGKVRFWGSITNNRLPDFYAAADLVVVPSRDAEGQGIVLLEAFAAGKCVLATRAGGIQEVITDGLTGLLVEPRNPEALCTAMVQLLTDERLRGRLAQAATRHVNDYSWEKVAEKFDVLYRIICRSDQFYRFS